MQPTDPNAPQGPGNIPQQPQQPYGPLPQPAAPTQPSVGMPPAQPQFMQQPAPTNPGMVQPQQQPFAAQPPVQPGMPYQPSVAPAPSGMYGGQTPSSSKFTPKKIGIIVAIVLVVFIGGFAVLKLGSKAADVVKTGSLSGGVALADYSNQELGFSIKSPEGWKTEVTNEEYRKDVTFDEPVGDINDKSEANSNYARLQVEQKDNTERTYSQKDETEYFDDLKKGLQAGLADQDTASTDTQIAALESEETITLDGKKAYKVKVKITNYGYEKGAIGYEYKVFVYQDKTMQYEILLSAHEADKAFLNEADEIINSFKTL